MSNLRHQLDEARSAYASIHYPDDLSSQVLPAGAARGRWKLPSALAGAIAATILLAFVYRGAAPERIRIHRDPVAAVHQGAVPTPILYNMPSRMPLTLPASPFMPATPPVLVSLMSFPETLEALQQPYEEFGPKLIESLNRHGIGFPARRPVENKATPTPGPATQDVVG